METHRYSEYLRYGPVLTIGRYRDWVNSPYPYTGSVTQLVEVRSGWNDSLYHIPSKDGKFRDGGLWLAYNKDILYSISSNAYLQTYRKGFGPAYEGTYKVDSAYANPWISSLVPAESPSDLKELAFEFGAEAWDKLKPDSPVFQAGLSLYELYESLNPLKDLLSKKRRQVRKEVARRRAHGQLVTELHVMNEFAVKPLMNMILDYVKAINVRKKAFDQLLRDESKPVRRTRVLAPKVKVIETHFDNSYSGYNNPNLSPILVTQCYPPGLTYRNIGVTALTEMVWCVGQARYLLPAGARNKAWERKMMRRVMGLNATPSTLWNAIPWSWLVDYFTGLGTFLQAASEGAAAHVWFDYAYVMRSTERTFTLSCYQYNYRNSAGNTNNNHSRVQVRVKTRSRVPASPFGWGIEDANLSALQWSILGSLGYSKLARAST
nr:MAG: hypothetical protein 1 [Leviviridae sp.]